MYIQLQLGKLNMSELISIESLQQLKEVMEDEFPLLVEMFVTDSAKLIQEIEQAYQAQDTEKLRIAAHTLKGISSNMAAVGFSGICKIIEDRARSAELEGLSEHIEELKSSYTQVIETIQSF